MNKPNEVIVLEDSPEAASIKTITGWVSRDGRFFGKDERLARFAGATHRTCAKCGEVHVINGYCHTCRDARENEKFNAMEKQDWNGIDPLVIFDSDIYFFDADDLDNYCAENDVKAHELRLVHCIPNMAREVESDYWEDALPEDGDIPKEMQEALDILNEAIRKAAPLSWSQGIIAAVVPEDWNTP